MRGGSRHGTVLSGDRGSPEAGWPAALRDEVATAAGEKKAVATAMEAAR